MIAGDSPFGIPNAPPEGTDGLPRTLIGTTLPGPTLPYFLVDVYRAELECLGWIMGIQALARKKAEEEAVRKAFRQEHLLAVLSRSFLSADTEVSLLSQAWDLGQGCWVQLCAILVRILE